MRRRALLLGTVIAGATAAALTVAPIGSHAADTSAKAKRGASVGAIVLPKRLTRSILKQPKTGTALWIPEDR